MKLVYKDTAKIIGLINRLEYTSYNRFHSVIDPVYRGVRNECTEMIDGNLRQEIEVDFL